MHSTDHIVFNFKSQVLIKENRKSLKQDIEPILTPQQTYYSRVTLYTFYQGIPRKYHQLTLGFIIDI